MISKNWMRVVVGILSAIILTACEAENVEWRSGSNVLIWASSVSECKGIYNRLVKELGQFGVNVRASIACGQSWAPGSQGAASADVDPPISVAYFGKSFERDRTAEYLLKQCNDEIDQYMAYVAKWGGVIISVKHCTKKKGQAWEDWINTGQVASVLSGNQASIIPSEVK
ncbi:MAG: hypothetical protein ACJ763_10805 [Bdellovibrionia bacterium]